MVSVPKHKYMAGGVKRRSAAEAENAERAAREFDFAVEEAADQHELTQEQKRWAKALQRVFKRMPEGVTVYVSHGTVIVAPDGFVEAVGELAIGDASATWTALNAADFPSIVTDVVAMSEAF